MNNTLLPILVGSRGEAEVSLAGIDAHRLFARLGLGSIDLRLLRLLLGTLLTHADVLGVRARDTQRTVRRAVDRLLVEGGVLDDGRRLDDRLDLASELLRLADLLLGGVAGLRLQLLAGRSSREDDEVLRVCLQARLPCASELY